MKHGFGVFITALLACASLPARAERQCDARSFGVQIDQAAQALRTLNRDSEARFQERLQVIGKSKGWTEAQKSDTAAAAMDDRRLESFNSEIEELVSQLDSLSATPKGEISCSRLDEIKAVREKLVGVMAKKSGFVLAQLEVEAAKPSTSSNPPTAIVGKSDALPRVTAPPPEPAQPERQPAPWSANVGQAAPTTPAPQAQRTAAPPLAPSTPAPAPAVPSSRPDPRLASLPPPAADPAPLPANPSVGYTPQEIRDAGRGIFGSLTSEFAIVINHAFRTYGQPNAYIIGDEGGGAFLAGLRYGDGKLYTRLNGTDSGPTPIYWQGPSIGADVGATGSRAIFLVYNLDDKNSLFQRFRGIDGAAYVAGGFGLTVYKSGNMVIVPIRTGLGLRLGASIAYLKFTERASLNPF